MSLLNKKIFTFHPRPFGLDISDLSLKAVWVDNEGRTDRIMGYGSIELPQGTIVDGEMAKPEAVVSAIRELLDTAKPKKITSREVVCSLPEMKAFLRIISLPQMSPEEAAQAIQWEIEGNIPLTLDQIYFDYQILDRHFGSDPRKMSALVVAVARNVVDQYVDALAQAGLHPVALETESLAQARSLLPLTEHKKTTLIVDLGDRRTSFLMAVGNVPVFTSSSPLSSQMITDAIAKALRMSFQEAEDLKLSQGIGTSGQNNPLFNIAQPLINDIAAEMERSIDFYLNSLGYSKQVDEIVLCGGGANLQGLAPTLSQRLGRPVLFGNPWVNLNLGKHLPPISKQLSVRYSTALGLGLRPDIVSL